MPVHPPNLTSAQSLIWGEFRTLNLGVQFNKALLALQTRSH